jgi:hypothetical protein
MNVKAMNFKMEESDILDMKQMASVFNMTMTDIVKEAVREYIEKMRKDPYYRLTVNVQEASAEESEEILAEINGLSDDDMMIVSSKQFQG